MMRYRTITLGCKVNQCESAAIGRLLEAAGCAKLQQDAPPDVVIINTCTVTGKAAMQSRQAIRKAVRLFPEARIVVTGCHAQIAPGQIRSIDGVDLIVGHHDKMRIAERLTLAAGANASEPSGAIGSIDPPAFSPLPPLGRNDRTRAFLKIQDGCNAFCTYCIVPYARGRSRSMPAADVSAHLQQATAEGFREVVLTGIHLGAYGADLDPPTHLTALLQKLIRQAAIHRIRLSSIEPTEIGEPMLELFGDGGEGPICRHFHIPLQSGDDAVLSRMGRPYTAGQFARLINHIHSCVPMAAIGVDVMAGFPGETDAAFDRTCRLIENLPITYLHVFPFSPRKGTPAAGFKDKVPERITGIRCRRLRQLGEEKRKAFLHRMIGRKVTVLIQTAGGPLTGQPRGLSDNYVPVTLEAGTYKQNDLVKVRVGRVSDEGVAIGLPT